MRLNARGVAIVMIEHIMRAVTQFSQRLVVLVAGRKVADGRPDEVLAVDRGSEGLSWGIALRSPIYPQATDRCLRCMASR